MKKLLLISAFALLVGCSSAEANDVADDGKCLDDIKHFNHLLKTTSADQSTKDAAKAKRDEGSEAWLKVRRRHVRLPTRPLGR